jgi:hypothetical protein
MIGSDEMQLGSLGMNKFLPKNDGKSGISIRDNRMRNSMKLEDIIHENLNHYVGCEWVLESKKMSIFGNTIKYHHDD